jgi:histidinol-phosphate aminotransferase
MNLSRRDLLTASALMLAGPAGALRLAGTASAESAAAVRPDSAATPSQQSPLVLCWNENPYGPSPAARLAVSHTIAEGCRYPPDTEINALVAELARHEGVDADHIVTGTGSGELLRALGFLYGHDGGEIVAATPTYEELAGYATRRGAAMRFVPVDAQLRHHLAAMHAAVSQRTRAVYLCNPNNPTGTALPAERIRDFVNALPESVVTIVDEAYMDFANAEGVASVADLVHGARRVIVLRTFSKIHGMAGLRCGYAIARPELAASLAGACMSTPNIFAIRAARASLADHDFLADCRRRVLASRTRIVSELIRLKLSYAEPQGNFVFFETGMPLPRFSAQMKARGILVGRQFPPYDNWCRITIGTEPEVEAFLRELRTVQAFA